MICLLTGFGYSGDTFFLVTLRYLSVSVWLGRSVMLRSGGIATVVLLIARSSRTTTVLIVASIGPLGPRRTSFSFLVHRLLLPPPSFRDPTAAI